MTYWQGPGTAPGYSREVEMAHEALQAARGQLLLALRESYPVGSPVRVVHYRGSFYGAVLGHDAEGSRVVVKNSISGKASKWWAAQVEVLAACARQEGGA